MTKNPCVPRAARFDGAPAGDTSGPTSAQADCAKILADYWRARRPKAKAKPAPKAKPKLGPPPRTRGASTDHQGVKGVCYDKVGRSYRPWIRVDGRQIWLGSFPTAEIARSVRAKALEARAMPREIEGDGDGEETGGKP